MRSRTWILLPLLVAVVLALTVVPGAARADEDEKEEQAEIKRQFVQVELMQRHFELLDRFADIAGEPAMAGVLALRSFVDDIDMKEKEKIEVLTSLLKSARSLDMRNAIRFSLKDLYIEADEPEMAARMLREIIQDCDRRLSDEGDDDDDDDDENDDD